MRKTTLAFLFLLFTINLTAQTATTAAGYYFSTTTNVSLADMAGSSQLIDANRAGAYTITLPLGFSFNFAGTNYDRFSVASAGVLVLGTLRATGHYWEAGNNIVPQNYPLFAPWSDELSTANNGEVHYKIFNGNGTRKLIVEWKVRTYNDDVPQYNKTFQIWLFENSNKIQFVYGNAFSSEEDNCYVGFAKSFNDHKTINTANHTVFNTSNTAWPGAGRSYIFTPDPAQNGPAPLTMGAAESNNASCGNNGSISLSNISGGYGIYNVSWSGPNGYTANTVSINNLAAGTYNYTITDASNVTPLSGSIVITQSASLAVEITQSASCQGTNSGSITMSNPSGGSGNYSFRLGSSAWQSSGYFGGLAAGIYTVQMKDAVNTSCIVTFENITVSTFNLTALLSSTASCDAGSNGSISINNAGGGSGNYQYRINNGSWQPAALFTGLAADTYTLDMYDVNNPNCIKNLGEQIVSSLALAGTTSATAACSGTSYGSITVSNASGGSGNFQFKLNSGSWQPAASFSGLAAGSYIVYMRDVNNIDCIKELGTQTVGSFNLNATVNSTSTCGSSNNGTVNIINTSGGSGNFQFKLNNGSWQPAASFSGLAAGSYVVYMRDVNNTDCIKELGTQTVTSFNLGATVSASSTCAGTNNGSITISNTSGGSGNYQFNINNGTWQSSAVFTGLATGNYIVQMRDANNQGCIKGLGTTTVSSYSLTATVNAASSCNGTSNGSINITNAAGGSGNYQYRINGGNWQTPGSFTGLNAGSYHIQMQDLSIAGCIKDLGNTSVQQSSAPVVSISLFAPAFCSTISLVADATNAVSYAWSNGGNSASIDLNNNSADGIYTVTVVNSNGCSGTGSYNFVKRNILNSYVIIGTKSVAIDESNVVNGAIGNNAAGQTVSINRNTVVNGYVVAPNISLQAPVTISGTTTNAVANVSLPTMFINITITNQLPNLSVPDDFIGAYSGNYNSVTIGRRAQVTLSGNIFGKMSIKECADVFFTATDLNIDDIKAEAGRQLSSGIDFLTINFAANSRIKMKKSVSLGEKVRVNGYGSVFYMGDLSNDPEKISITGRNTIFNASCYIPRGSLTISGYDAQFPCIMNGTFISETIVSDKYTVWNRVECSNSSNAQRFQADPEITMDNTVAEEKSQPVIIAEDKEAILVESANQANRAVVLYPSPNTGRFNVRLPAQVKTAEIVILNQVGVEISRTKAINLTKDQELKCDISKNPAGYYLIRIITEKGTFIKSFIKSD